MSLNLPAFQEDANASNSSIKLSEEETLPRGFLSSSWLPLGFVVNLAEPSCLNDDAEEWGPEEVLRDDSSLPSATVDK
jgi:hypothetical protein